MNTNEMQADLLEKLYNETIQAIKECNTSKEKREILNATANVFAFSLEKSKVAAE